MVCTNPITIRNKNSKGIDDRSMVVPCGKCIACRIAKKREWKIRLLHESYYWEDTAYITLTYNDECLPEDYGLHKKELQDFIKRLRKAVEPEKIKYYAVGEYGDEYGRPHYHAIVFGISQFREQLINKCWNKGWIKIGSVEHDSIQYVTGYIEKKLYGEMAEDQYQGRQPPFAIMSKGLGKRYAEAKREEITKNKSILYRGKNQGLPRYYQKVLDIDSEELIQKGQEHSDKVEAFWRSKGSQEVERDIWMARIQNELNIKARMLIAKNKKRQNGKAMRQ